MKFWTIFIPLVLIFPWISVGETNACGKGSFLSDGKCVSCPKGTYQPESNQTECILCPQGTYNPFRGAQGVDICRECPEGTFQNRLGATSMKDCKQCPGGQNAPEGSPSCISCPAGSVISLCDSSQGGDPIESSRGTCFSFFFSLGGAGGFNEIGPTKPRCNTCFPNETSDTNSFECKQCPSGLFRAPDSPSCRRLTCPPGTGFNVFGFCTECFNPRFNDGSQGECIQCPPGHKGNRETGATSCIQCPGDEFFDNSVNECKKCGPGLTSTATNGVLCLPEDFGCPSNFFRNNDGKCETCPRQTRLSEKKKICVPCPENHESNGGINTRCTPCPPGMIFTDGPVGSRCYCKPGFGFVEGLNGMKCERCPPGTASNGLNMCRRCPTGTFAANSGSKECADCPKGMSQPNRGASSCITPICDKGLTISNEGECVVPGTGCPRNSRREERFEFPGQIQCQAERCPSDTVLMTFETFSGTIRECGGCRRDQRFVEDTSTCVSCTEGEFSEGGLSKDCKRCPPGQVFSLFYDSCVCSDSRQTKGGRCVVCPKGTAGFFDIEGCLPCPKGTISDSNGSSFCSKCPAGTFSNKTGSSRCIKCPPGTRSFGSGNTKCS